MSDAQLADIGISRAEAAMVFDPHFAARHNRERLVARTQTGRIATV